MKPVIPILFLILTAFDLAGQTSITFDHNSFIAGDSDRIATVPYVDPGSAGMGRIWDFSGLKYTAAALSSRVVTAPDAITAGPEEHNLSLDENGYQYFLLQDSETVKETGYLNPGKKMSMTYTDPVERLRFPLHMNDRYSDNFSGTAFYREKSRIDVTGEYTVEVDGNGTLILPDRILPQTLRVKTTRRSLQTGVCGSTVSTVTKYQWYTQGHRYPVLVMSMSESVHAANAPVFSGTGYITLDNAGNHENPALTANTEPGLAGSVPVTVYPNPFAERTTYSYYLPKTKKVAAEITDLAGSMRKTLIDNEMKGPGLHNGEIDAVKAGLTPGIYLIRFMFDGQPVVVKVIKI